MLAEEGRIRPARRLDDSVKVREVVRLLRGDGWFLARQRGSHRHFKHLTKRGTVTVPGRASDDLAPGTLDSILKQAQLK